MNNKSGKIRCCPSAKRLQVQQLQTDIASLNNDINQQISNIVGEGVITNDTSEINGYTADAQNCAVLVQTFTNLVNHGLVLDIQVNDAVLQAGMTPGQVQQALAAAASVPLAAFVTDQIG